MKSSPDAMTQQIRVLLADDHPVVREGLAAILKSQKDIEIVAEAANGEEACELYDQLSPDVLLLDLRMPKKDGLQVITELMTRSAPKPRIMVMTFYESEQDIRRVLKAGAKAFLVKGSHPQQIREAVRRVAQGENFLPPEIGFKLAESMSHPELSNRETQVLQYLACGRSNKEIGRALYISEGTVKHHVKSILSKLDAIGRAEAVAIAARRGLIHLGQAEYLSWSIAENVAIGSFSRKAELAITIMKEIAAQEASTLAVIVGGGFGQDEFISLTEKGVPMKYSVKMNLCLGPFRMTGGTRR